MILKIKNSTLILDLPRFIRSGRSANDLAKAAKDDDRIALIKKIKIQMGISSTNHCDTLQSPSASEIQEIGVKK